MSRKAPPKGSAGTRNVRKGKKQLLKTYKSGCSTTLEERTRRISLFIVSFPTSLFVAERQAKANRT